MNSSKRKGRPAAAWAAASSPTTEGSAAEGTGEISEIAEAAD